MAGNKNLHKAKEKKNDEFYTQLSDIENELRHYRDHFKDKTVFLNCDDPYESDFFKYFAMNFNHLGLKKLIATCYSDSFVAGKELTLFNWNQHEEHIPAHKIVINEVVDFNEDGAVDLSDIEYLLKNRKNVLTELIGDGDFRSEECINLLKEADIVVTNPPFSLWREHISQLIEFEKDFLILGNPNAITYKEIFPLLMGNKVWLGNPVPRGSLWFNIPDYLIKEISKKDPTCYRIHNGSHQARRPSAWYTNLDIPKRHEDLILWKKYNPEDYPKYDNYDAININKVAEIPADYKGVMGVPISFLDKYNPDQFEILGLSQKVGFGLNSNRFYDDYAEIKQDGIYTGSSGKKTNGNPVMLGKPSKNNYYINKDGRCVHSLYARIFIKRKDTI